MLVLVRVLALVRCCTSVVWGRCEMWCYLLGSWYGTVLRVPYYTRILILYNARRYIYITSRHVHHLATRLAMVLITAGRRANRKLPPDCTIAFFLVFVLARLSESKRRMALCLRRDRTWDLDTGTVPWRTLSAHSPRHRTSPGSLSINRAFLVLGLQVHITCMWG